MTERIVYQAREVQGHFLATTPRYIDPLEILREEVRRRDQEKLAQLKNELSEIIRERGGNS